MMAADTKAGWHDKQGRKASGLPAHRRPAGMNFALSYKDAPEEKTGGLTLDSAQGKRPGLHIAEESGEVPGIAKGVADGEWKSAIGELGVPLLAAAFGGQVEEVPERPDHVHVAAVMARLAGREEHLGVEEMMNRAIAARENVQRGPLSAVRGLPEIIAIVSVAGRREQAEVWPMTLAGERADALERGFGDDDEVDALREMGRGAVEAIENGGAGRARRRHGGAEHEAVDGEGVLAGAKSCDIRVWCAGAESS